MHRQACSSMYCIHMGPQEFCLFLARHESVCHAKHFRYPVTVQWNNRNIAEYQHRQPILADEIQTFKALITVHKVLQEGHPIVLKEAQSNTSWLESLSRGSTGGEGARGYAPLISEYIYYLMAKLAFHRQHPEFNGTTQMRGESNGKLTLARNFRVRGIH
jgi:hypothetical protein